MTDQQHQEARAYYEMNTQALQKLAKELLAKPYNLERIKQQIELVFFLITGHEYITADEIKQMLVVTRKSWLYKASKDKTCTDIAYVNLQIDAIVDQSLQLTNRGSELLAFLDAEIARDNPQNSLKYIKKCLSRALFIGRLGRDNNA